MKVSIVKPAEPPRKLAAIINEAGGTIWIPGTDDNNIIVIHGTSGRATVTNFRSLEALHSSNGGTAVYEGESVLLQF